MYLELPERVKKSNTGEKGRPEIFLDMDQIRSYMQAGCSAPSIAGFLKIDRKTLYKKVEEKWGKSFGECLDDFKDEGRDLLKFAQFKKALDGNVPLLIWLGKQLLGQRENHQEMTISKENKENIERLLAALAPKASVTTALAAEKQEEIGQSATVTATSAEVTG